MIPYELEQDQWIHGAFGVADGQEYPKERLDFFEPYRLILPLMRGIKGRWRQLERMDKALQDPLHLYYRNTYRL